jgi:hypothetical protein
LLAHQAYYPQTWKYGRRMFLVQIEQLCACLSAFWEA